MHCLRKKCTECGGANALDNNGNGILTITQDEYTDEFRRIQEESLGLLPEDVASFHRDTRRLTEGEQRRMATAYGRLLAGSDGSRAVSWADLTSSKTGATFRVSEVNGQLFHDIFQINRQYLPNGELVDLHDDYSNAKCFLTDDGLQGFAIEENGNAVSLFSLNPARLQEKTGFLYAIGDFIRANGGTHLDAYASPNQNLEAIYKKTLGFKTAARMDYNMEFDHDDIAANHSQPAVVFMVDSRGEVEERHFGKDDYDAAQAYQLAQIESSREADGDGLDVRYHKEGTGGEQAQPSRYQEQRRTLHDATQELRPSFARDFFQNATRISCGNDARRNVFCHDASGTDDRSRADFYAGQNHGIPADPNIVADFDFASAFESGSTRRGVERMFRRINSDARAEQNIFPDFYAANVDDDAVVICVKTVADENIFPVIATKRRLDVNARSRASKKFA